MVIYARSLIRDNRKFGVECKSKRSLPPTNVNFKSCWEFQPAGESLKNTINRNRRLVENKSYCQSRVKGQMPARKEKSEEDSFTTAKWIMRWLCSPSIFGNVSGEAFKANMFNELVISSVMLRYQSAFWPDFDGLQSSSFSSINGFLKHSFVTCQLLSTFSNEFCIVEYELQLDRFETKSFSLRKQYKNILELFLHQRQITE